MNHPDHRIADLVINEARLLTNLQAQSERQRILTDILDHNYFYLAPHTGPFSLHIAIIEYKCILDIANASGHLTSIPISLMPLKRMIKDYRIVCETYLEALHTADPSKVEAIDMGRRAVHNEGAEILQESLPSSVHIDFETARKFFTLIYLLQSR